MQPENGNGNVTYAGCYPIYPFRWVDINSQNSPAIEIKVHTSETCQGWETLAQSNLKDLFGPLRVENRSKCSKPIDSTLVLPILPKTQVVWEASCGRKPEPVGCSCPPVLSAAATSHPKSPVFSSERWGEQEGIKGSCFGWPPTPWWLQHCILWIGMSKVSHCLMAKAFPTSSLTYEQHQPWIQKEIDKDTGSALILCSSPKWSSDFSISLQFFQQHLVEW